MTPALVAVVVVVVVVAWGLYRQQARQAAALGRELDVVRADLSVARDDLDKTRDEIVRVRVQRGLHDRLVAEHARAVAVLGDLEAIATGAAAPPSSVAPDLVGSGAYVAVGALVRERDTLRIRLDAAEETIQGERRAYAQQLEEVNAEVIEASQAREQRDRRWLGALRTARANAHKGGTVQRVLDGVIENVLGTP